MATNINTFLFTRTNPQTKLSVIDNLSDSEILNTNIATITRIIKEAGEGKPRSRNKTLYLRRPHPGNNWNSDVEDISIYKGKLWIGFYLQYENTDTSDEAPLKDFMRPGDYRGSIERDDRYGNPRHYYFTYDSDDKVRVLRAILKEYVLTKYHDKLQSNG